MFVTEYMGDLVPISGTDARGREWQARAFVPAPLPEAPPELSNRTHTAVANARASLASLSAQAARLENPALLRQPTLRREAQSTSALEGTFAPLESVLAASEQDGVMDASMREVLNYVRIAEQAFGWVGDGRPITVGLLEDLQRDLVRGTSADTDQAGRVRTTQVMIGSGPNTPVSAARFIPSPPGPGLDAALRDQLAWAGAQHRRAEMDPVIEAGVAHYQFETLHPFNDGNGRIGRLLIVLHLLTRGVLTEPTLSVSPWFEARRSEYYDRLLRLSTHGDWDGWLLFFATGINFSAESTSRQLADLIDTQSDLKDRIRKSELRSDNAIRAMDFATARPIFTARELAEGLSVSYPRANGLIGQLTARGILRQWGADLRDRRFTAPEILSILLDPAYVD